MNEQETSTKKHTIKENLPSTLTKAGLIISLIGVSGAIIYTMLPDKETEQLEVNGFKKTELAITQSEDSIYLRKTNTFDTTSYFIGAIAKKDIDTLNMSYNSSEVYCDDTVIEFKGVPSKLEELAEKEVLYDSKTTPRIEWQKAASKISNEMSLPQYTKITNATVYAPRTRN